MGLIECPDCNKNVSTSAENCPECGRPMRKDDDLENDKIEIVGMFRSVSQDYFKAAGEVFVQPFLFLLWFLSFLVSNILIPVWGAIFIWVGWLNGRKKIMSEGVIGIEEILFPAIGRKFYTDGIWRGLWRAHKVSIAVNMIQFPIVLLLSLPILLFYLLFTPVAQFFPGDVGQYLSIGIPSVIGVFCTSILLSQYFILIRILSVSGPEYSLGKVYYAVKKAWKMVLSNIKKLFYLIILIGLSFLFVFALYELSGKLAESLNLGAGKEFIEIWYLMIFGLLSLVVNANALAAWSTDLKVLPIPDTTYFSFSNWLVTWLQSLSSSQITLGLIKVGLAICLLIGVANSIIGLILGQSSDSWVSVGWYAVTVCVLFFLNKNGVKK